MQKGDMWGGAAALMSFVNDFDALNHPTGVVSVYYSAHWRERDLKTSVNKL